jgi:hypothetical protein
MLENNKDSFFILCTKDKKKLKTIKDKYSGKEL